MISTHSCKYFFLYRPHTQYTQDFIQFLEYHTLLNKFRIFSIKVKQSPPMYALHFFTCYGDNLTKNDENKKK